METTITCPFCGEPTEVSCDEDAGKHVFIQDCDVCCHPIQVVAHVSPDGELSISAERD